MSLDQASAVLGATSPADAAELLDSTAIVVLSLGVLALITFVILLGRELMRSRLSVRMLAENQRLSRREQQHQRALEKASGRRALPAVKLQSGKLRRVPEPPPLPEPKDWSDSLLRTEVRSDLPADEAEMRAAEIEERLLDPDASTVEFPLVAGANKRPGIWPGRKVPRKPDGPTED